MRFCTVNLIASASVMLAVLGIAQENIETKSSEPVVKYKSIMVRNVFGLKEPTPPPAPPPPPPPATKVNLTGITTIFSTKRALLQITAPGKPPDTKVMKEGESQDQIEVLTIDEVNGAVTIRNADQEVKLTFEKDGVKATSGPPPANPPPGVPMPGMAPKMPGQPGYVPPGQPAPMPMGAYVPPGSTPGVVPGAPPSSVPLFGTNSMPPVINIPRVLRR